jgi:RNase P/RNase MRP subunit p30
LQGNEPGKLRKFADLHLRPASHDVETGEKMAQLAAEIGFYLVGIAFDYQVPKRQRQNMIKLFENQGLKTVTRIDVRPRGKNELLRSLRTVREAFDIVAVECSNRQISSVAFRDKRVDLIFFPSNRLESRLSLLMPKRLKRPIEFNITDMFDAQSAPALNLRRSLNLLAEARRKRMPILVSSGAKNPVSMKSARDMAAVISALGLEAKQGIDSVSSIPISLTTMALNRQEPGFIAQGTRVVRTRP